MTYLSENPLAPSRSRGKRSHADDLAVDRFAAAMKAKLAKKRDQGAGGWETASAEHLNQLIANHIEKGDPVDVANLAMMLWNNGQKCAPIQIYDPLGYVLAFRKARGLLQTVIDEEWLAGLALEDVIKLFLEMSAKRAEGAR